MNNTMVTALVKSGRLNYLFIFSDILVYKIPTLSRFC